MSLDNILETARLALNNERLRAEIASLNISRANTPLSTKQVSRANFNQRLSEDLNIEKTGNDNTVNNNTVNNNTGNIRLQYDPSNPIANENGFVSYPNVDLVTEFINLSLAKRAYEANVRIFNTASSMHQKAMELGRV